LQLAPRICQKHTHKIIQERSPWPRTTHCVRGFAFQRSPGNPFQRVAPTRKLGALRQHQAAGFSLQRAQLPDPVRSKHHKLKWAEV
jgi:hypothetical protein